MHPVVKPTVFFGGTLGVLVLAVSLSIFKISTAIAYRIFEVHATPVSAASDAASRSRGQHLTHVVLGCTDCHGEDLAGAMLVDNVTTGLIAGPNLTRGDGGRSATWSDLDFVRAVRHGVNEFDKGLWFMPTRAYASLSDPDMAALLAELHAAPPVDKRWATPSLSYLGRLRVALRQVRPLQVTEAPQVTVPAADPAPTAPFGQYLATIAGCLDCHNEAASLPSGPPPIKLNREALARYDGEAFTRLMRTGTRPDGTTLRDNRAMHRLRQLSDMEIAALWAYLPSVY